MKYEINLVKLIKIIEQVKSQNLIIKDMKKLPVPSDVICFLNDFVDSKSVFAPIIVSEGCLYANNVFVQIIKNFINENDVYYNVLKNKFQEPEITIKGNLRPMAANQLFDVKEFFKIKKEMTELNLSDDVIENALELSADNIQKILDATIVEYNYHKNIPEEFIDLFKG